MQAVDSLLYSSAAEALSSLGEPTRLAILSQLRREEIQFSPGQLDLKEVEQKLRQLFGLASPVLIAKILDLFLRKAIAAGYLGPATIFNYQSSQTAYSRKFV